MGSNFPGSMLISDGEVRTQYTTQRNIPLGTRAFTRDGRVFRWSNAGAAITVGRLCQARAPSTWSDDMTFKAVNYAIGSSQVVVRIDCASTAAKSSDGTTDYFKEGYLFINHGTGEGQYMPIKYQGGWTTATTAGHYSTVHFADEAKLTIAVSSASECGFVLNTYKRVVMHPKAATSIPVGIAPLTVSSGRYFWLQTWGPAAYKAGGTLIAGRACIPDLGTNTGFIEIMTSESAATKSSDIGKTGEQYPMVGTCMEVGANGETGFIFLTIAS